jgi:hypothetical protein
VCLFDCKHVAVRQEVFFVRGLNAEHFGVRAHVLQFSILLHVDRGVSGDAANLTNT